MNVIALNDPSSDFSLVEVRSSWPNTTATPHCKVHGAMNKVTEGSDGIWRCLAAHSRTKIIKGNSVSYKENDTVCRAACKQGIAHQRSKGDNI